MGLADSPLRDRVVFVVGAPRSGTYWVQRLITAHPRVAAVPNETQLFSHAIAPLMERFHHGSKASVTVGVSYVERAVLIERLRELCDSVLAPYLEAGAELLCERSAFHVLHLGLIGEVYPDARVVHVIRDGRDVARSQLTHDWGPDAMEEAARGWREAVLAGRRDAPERYREVRYEELLADPQEHARTFYAWFGLDTDAEVLERVAEDAAVQVNVDPHGTPAAAGKWRNGLDPEQVRDFERAAGELLEELGYPPADAAAGGAKGSRNQVQAPGPAPRPRRIRKRLARLRARLRSRSQPTQRPLASQAIFDRVLGALHSGRLEDLDGVLLPDAYVKVVEGGRETLREGLAARAALAAAASADPAFRGRQLESQVYPAVAGTTGVLAYELDGGRILRRVVVVATQEGRVKWLALHRLPE